jgi:hypothetical protein
MFLGRVMVPRMTEADQKTISVKRAHDLRLNSFALPHVGHGEFSLNRDATTPRIADQT